MLNAKQRRAVKLLFRMDDDEVAVEIGVMPKTLARWKSNREFRQAMINEENAIRLAVGRIAGSSSLKAAMNLQRLLSEGKDGKLMVDVLKAAGAFTRDEASAMDALNEIIRQVRADAEAE